MRHLMSPLDFSVEELDQLLDLASDIEKHPKKYAHACDGKKLGQTEVTYDTTSKQGKAYQEGKTVDDNLKTAPVASKRKDAIHKGIEFSLRLLVAVILIILIMHLIHRHELEKRRKNRISRRKKK